MKIIHRLLVVIARLIGASVSSLTSQADRPNQQAGLYASFDEWLSIDVIYTLALRELDAQIKDWDQANDRLRLLLGFVGLISTALTATGQITINVPSGTSQPIPTPSVLIIAGFAGVGVLWLLLAGVVAALAYLPREFHRPPNIRELRLSFLTTPAAETKRAIVDEILAVYNLNQEKIADKLRAYRIAQWLFLCAIVFFAVAIIVRLLIFAGVAK